MKNWNNAEVEELKFEATAAKGGNGNSTGGNNNGTGVDYMNKDHKGSCEARWNPIGACTCGAASHS